MQRIRRKKRKVTKKVKAIGLVALLASATAFVCCTPYFNIGEIRLVGNDKIERTSILTAGEIYEGANIFSINLAVAENKIKQLHFVDEVVIKRHFPNILSIELTESTAAAYIPFMGNYIGIDYKGKILQLDTPAQKGELPTFFGVNAKEFNVGQKIRLDQTEKFDIILVYINSITRSKYANAVTSVDITHTDNVSLMLWDKLLVNVGNEERLDYKFQVLATMLAEIGEGVSGTINLQNTSRTSYRAGPNPLPSPTPSSTPMPSPSPTP